MTASMTAVTYEVQGDIATLTLNRPESLNALNLAMIDDLRATTARAAFDPAVRVVIVRGAGEHAQVEHDQHQHDEHERCVDGDDHAGRR